MRLKLSISALLLVALGTSACGEWEAGFPSMRFTGGSPESPVSIEQFCRFSREALGLPVLLSAERRKEAYAVLGAQKASELFRPLARTNNSFRCLCGTPQERELAKC